MGEKRDWDSEFEEWLNAEEAWLPDWTDLMGDWYHLGVLPEHMPISQEIPAKERPGFIYVLKAENGLCKIGRTRLLTKRAEKLSIEVPLELELVHSIACDDMVKTEALFHERFREKRVKGEWFRLNEEDLIWVKSHPGW